MTFKMTRHKALLITRINVRTYNDMRYTPKNRVECGATAKHYMNKYNLTKTEVRGKKGKKWFFPEVL